MGSAACHPKGPRLQDPLRAGRWGSRGPDRVRRAPEWLYVFKPEVAGTVVYLKLIVRADCVVISFHDDEGDGDEDAWD
jgi:hypothetical protein